MCRSLLFFLICFVAAFTGCATSKPVVEDENVVVWKEDRLLQWSDFRGPVIESEIDWSAVTSTFFGFQKLGKNKILIGAYFNRIESWSVRQSDALLKHEQYHFNISEIFARQMRKKVYEENLRSEKALKDLYSVLLQEYKAMQSEYDVFTGHGKNKAYQFLQEKLIDENFAALDAFKDPVVVLN